MNKYRRKACLDEKGRSSLIVIDSETDEQEELSPLIKRVKGGEKAKLQQSANPYEKIK